MLELYTVWLMYTGKYISSVYVIQDWYLFPYRMAFINFYSKIVYFRGGSGAGSLGGAQQLTGGG